MIITHTSPDFDAIGSCWLLQRYGGMSDMPIVFVHTGSPDRELLDNAAAVVDTGRALDSANNRFDHHHLPGAMSNETCATYEVWFALLDRNADDVTGGHYRSLMRIKPLIDLIYAGDTGKPSANESRRLGIHALLSAQKAKRLDNAALLAYGYTLLDDLAASLIAHAESAASLSKHTVYASADGLVVALKDAPQGATFAAHEHGARLVIFASELPGTFARGVMRGGEGTDVHCGDLIEKIVVDLATPIAIGVELDSWFRHEAGFFAGKGTAKAPCADPMTVDIVDIASAIDIAWQR